MNRVKDTVENPIGQLAKVNDLGDPEPKERGSKLVTC